MHSRANEFQNVKLESTMKPQHFDILDSLAFAYVTAFALYALTHGGDASMWSIILLAIIGVGGFVVDVAIVFIYFIRKQ